MFHKEQLCHVLESKISWWYSKLLFLDCDIVFDNPGWYDELSKKLDLFQVVHPFEVCKWLDLSYTSILLERRSVVTQQKEVIYNPTYHPGFAWAFQRKWFKNNGFFRYAITGSGDTLSAAAWLNQNFDKYYLLPSALKPSYMEYKSRLKRPTISYLPGTIYHLYHGERKNRKYSERHKLLDGFDDIRKEIKISFWGIFYFKKSDLKEKMHRYFLERSDDAINEFQDVNLMEDESLKEISIDY